jgi:hypothetical protein
MYIQDQERKKGMAVVRELATESGGLLLPRSAPLRSINNKKRKKANVCVHLTATVSVQACLCVCMYLNGGPRQIGADAADARRLQLRNSCLF